ncbi:uncharacterized protein BP5553_08598 [Venustampulla echinocandica]|uniref:Uncharacterized protein n=1 Tax=Venustampulla echinocandica TaxID=2656787 RepID=A0A370TEQ5_9HELO|nr:uncharacterized protein BP5553_08598 [Venustampulla echinocandica]RDL33159.1 hypothetical protein BP5553_08598 [Venustampulla echinocandica]
MAGLTRATPIRASCNPPEDRMANIVPGSVEHSDAIAENPTKGTGQGVSILVGNRKRSSKKDDPIGMQSQTVAIEAVVIAAFRSRFICVLSPPSTANPIRPRYPSDWTDSCMPCINHAVPLMGRPHMTSMKGPPMIS